MKYETFAKHLGKRLAYIRNEMQMTQAQIARRSGLSLKYVSMIESGTNPSVRTIMRMCNALGTDISEVMEQAGIGSLPGRKSAKVVAVQIDVPADDPQMKKLIKFIKRLDANDRRKALKLIKTSFRGM